MLNKVALISASFSIVSMMAERSWIGWGYRNRQTCGGIMLGTCAKMPRDSVYWLPSDNIQFMERLVGLMRGMWHQQDMCQPNFLILLTSSNVIYSSGEFNPEPYLC